MTSSAEVVKEKLPTISEKIKINNLAESLLEVTKKSIRFLKEDFTKQHLLWVKVVFFLQSASLVTLYPYLVSLPYFIKVSVYLTFYIFLKMTPKYSERCLRHIYINCTFVTDFTSKIPWFYNRRCIPC